MANRTVLLARRERATATQVDYGPYGLPPELLARARGRLEKLALVFALVFVAAIGVSFVLYLFTDVHPLEDALANAGASGLGAALGLGLWALTRMKRFSHRAVLNTGLGFQAVLSYFASAGTFNGVYSASGYLPEVTWSIAIIIIFPLVIPTRPLRTILTSSIAAAMAPLALYHLSVQQIVLAEPLDYMRVSLSPAFSVIIAYFMSRVVYGLSVDVARARQLGSYKLERVLGRGGMGEVWAARHQMLARPAAVKLIRAGGTEEDEMTLRRFEHEAQATAKLRSPHTIEIYDYGRTEDGTFFYVMELLDGLDLETMVHNFGALTSARVIHILNQTCHSLHEAHTAGLVHRDIKPANIFVCRYGQDFDFVKVLDFGLVKDEQHMTKDASLTQEGIAVGTPAYMAPEMAVGKTQVGAAADMYALGCVAYFALTARKVFEGDNALQFMVHHARDEPQSPSAVCEQDIDPTLEQWVMRCLLKEPAQRPKADELAQALMQIHPQPSWHASQRQSWWQEHDARLEQLSHKEIAP